MKCYWSLMWHGWKLFQCWTIVGAFTASSLGEAFHLGIILGKKLNLLLSNAVEMFMKRLMCPLVLFFKLSHCRVNNISLISTNVSVKVWHHISSSSPLYWFQLLIMLGLSLFAFFSTYFSFQQFFFFLTYFAHYLAIFYSEKVVFGVSPAFEHA